MGFSSLISLISKNIHNKVTKHLLYLFLFVRLPFSKGKVHSITIYSVDITKQVDCASSEWLIFNSNIAKDRDRYFTGNFFDTT